MFRLGLIRCHLVGNVFALKTWFQCQKLYAWATEVLLQNSANCWCDRALSKWWVLLISPLTGHRLGLSCFAYLQSCLSNRSCVTRRLMRPIGTFESKPRRMLYCKHFCGLKIFFFTLCNLSTLPDEANQVDLQSLTNESSILLKNDPKIRTTFFSTSEIAHFLFCPWFQFLVTAEKKFDIRFLLFWHFSGHFLPKIYISSGESQFI